MQAFHAPYTGNGGLPIDEAIFAKLPCLLSDMRNPLNKWGDALWDTICFTFTSHGRFTVSEAARQLAPHFPELAPRTLHSYINVVLRYVELEHREKLTDDEHPLRRRGKYFILL